MPLTLTNPPAGMALITYSVSPFWKDAIFGPMPMLKVVTYMPLILATTK